MDLLTIVSPMLRSVTVLSCVRGALSLDFNKSLLEK